MIMEIKESKWDKVRRTHSNSIEAYYDGLLTGIFSKKEDDILRCLRAIGKGTDRQISEWLGCEHKSEVQPRISELIEQARILEECGNSIDPISQKTVRVVRIIPKDDKNQLTFNW
jgi:hypothetical protein